MKKTKYLFLGCLVIIGVFVVSYIHNVDAYDMPIQTAVTDQKADSFTDTSSTCPYHVDDCNKNKTYCSLGHVNCTIEHQQHTTTHHKTESHHREYRSHSQHH